MPKGTPLSEAQVKGFLLMIRDHGLSVEKAASANGISRSQGFRIKADADRIWAEMGEAREVVGIADAIQRTGERERIRRAIAEQGPFATVEDLMKAVARPGEMPIFNSFVGTCWSLKKQGEIAFDTTTNKANAGHGPSNNAVIRIRPTKLLLSRLGIAKPGKDWPPTKPGPQPVHKVGKDMTDSRQHGRVAAGGPVERRTVDRPIPEPGVVTPVNGSTYPAGVDPTDHHTQPDETYEVPRSFEEVVEAATPVTVEEALAMTVTVPEYPILTALRAKRVEVDRAREAAKLLEQAAELLSGDERESLLTSAAGLIEDHDLTPAEAEYLAYAEAHDGLAR